MDLFEGERIDFSDEAHPPVAASSREEIDEKYARGDVRIVTEQARYPLNTILSMLESRKYNLNPEFQRRKRWNRQKQSRLIESFIMNVPIPPIFLYEVAYSQYEVMDGLQRLTAIKEFYSCEFALSGLEQWPELNGMTYRSLPEQVQRGIDRRYLSSIILLRETARDETEAERLKQLVFERINSGGEKLEPQEARNALYNGPLNQLCAKLSRHDSFCKMWGIPTEDDLRADPEQLRFRFLAVEEVETYAEPAVPLQLNPLYRKMQDVELVLRFFAYRQLTSIEQGRLQDFLDAYLRNGNRLQSSVLDALSALFCNTCDLIYRILGERAFFLLRRRGLDSWGWFERPTKVLYDPLMHAFSRHLADAPRLIEQKDEIVRGLVRLYKEHADTFEGRSTNQEDIVGRMRLLDSFIESLLH